MSREQRIQELIQEMKQLHPEADIGFTMLPEEKKREFANLLLDLTPPSKETLEWANQTIERIERERNEQKASTQKVQSTP